MSGLLSEQEAEPESCVLVLNDPFPLAEARAELGVMKFKKDLQYLYSRNAASFI